MKNNLTIYSNIIPIEILKNNFLSFPQNLPKYYKNIPRLFNRSETSTTIKTCPGFVNYFRKVLVFTSPFDMEFLISNNKLEQWAMGNGDYNNLMSVTTHSNLQLLDYVQNDNYQFVIKICMFNYIQSDAPLYFHNASWEFRNWECLPGVIHPKDIPTDLNMFLPVRKETDKIVIKKDEPLFYMSFETQDDIELHFSDKKFDLTSHTNTLSYKFSILKDRILGKKIV